jgi:hypothetical protein
MRLITILLLTTFLASCRSVQTQMVCNELRNQQIKPVEMCDISFKFNRCRCRMFDINSWNALSEAVDHPLNYCDGIAGFRLEDIATEIRPKIKAMYRLKGNLCGENESTETTQQDQETVTGRTEAEVSVH